MIANVNLPKECIEALLAAGVYQHNPSNAQDLDIICTAEAMQCLVGYALHPSFSDPAFSVAINLAREKIAQLEYSINDQLDTTTKYNVNFDVGRLQRPFITKSFKTLSAGLRKRPEQR